MQDTIKKEFTFVFEIWLSSLIGIAFLEGPITEFANNEANPKITILFASLFETLFITPPIVIGSLFLSAVIRFIFLLLRRGILV